MRKALLAVGTAACLGAFCYPATAAPLGHPDALSGAAADLSTIDTVHCRPGWAHHSPSRWRRADGCGRRAYYGGYGGYYRPGYVYGGGPYYGGYGGPYGGYYGGPGFYGPGISLGFGVGPRRWGW